MALANHIVSRGGISKIDLSEQSSVGYDRVPGCIGDMISCWYA